MTYEIHIHYNHDETYKLQTNLVNEYKIYLCGIRLYKELNDTTYNIQHKIWELMISQSSCYMVVTLKCLTSVSVLW